MSLSLATSGRSRFRNAIIATQSQHFVREPPRQRGGSVLACDRLANTVTSMRLYALVEAGDPEAIDVYLCEQDAQRALEDCLRDEPQPAGPFRTRGHANCHDARRSVRLVCGQRGVERDLLDVKNIPPLLGGPFSNESCRSSSLGR